MPPPAFRSDEALGFHSNGFSFKVAGVGGQAMVIEVSTNLMNWAPLITNTLETGGLIFTDQTSTNFPVRFYRARLR